MPPLTPCLLAAVAVRERLRHQESHTSAKTPNRR